MKKREIGWSLWICTAILLLLSGCAATKSYDFRMGNGEAVRVKMEVGDGYDLLTDGSTFSVRKDGEELLSGLLITDEGYEVNSQAVRENPDLSDILLDTPTVLAFQYDTEEGRETDFLLRIEDSECAAALISFSPYQEAKAAFDRISFERIS